MKEITIGGRQSGKTFLFRKELEKHLNTLNLIEVVEIYKNTKHGTTSSIIWNYLKENYPDYTE